LDLLTSGTSSPIKAFIIGKQGTGKTGSKASLVAMGYKLRMLNFDNGADILKNLLTNPYYPYRKYMQDKNIPLKGAISVITIAEEMKKITEDSKSRFIPKSARGYSKATDMMNDWVDGDEKLGSILSWGNDTILDIDTLGTLADLAYFHTQELNGRLGARQEGFDYQRDVGGAQGLLRNLMQTLFHPLVKCNVLINAHITYVDESKGTYERPNLESISDPIGYPSAIGRAISPVIGKWFNNVLIIDQTGSGPTEKHEISTVPIRNIAAKNSLPGVLKKRYSIETGLAEIFCALRGEKPPLELIERCKPKSKVTSIPGAKTNPIPILAK
jgi:hypothetical protein